MCFFKGWVGGGWLCVCAAHCCVHMLGTYQPWLLRRAGGNPDSNTLISDMATVICLDDYHCLDRTGRAEKGVTALAPEAQNVRNAPFSRAALHAEHVHAQCCGTLHVPPMVESGVEFKVFLPVGA